MSFVMLALLVALTAATMIVLADSGLRLWFALGGIKAQRASIAQDAANPPQLRKRVSTRVNYAQAIVGPCAPMRAAA